jgi:hypothetical protein
VLRPRLTVFKATYVCAVLCHVQALCLACGSDPDKGTAKKMGAYVMKTCFQTTTVSRCVWWWGVGGWGEVGTGKGGVHLHAHM